MTDRHHAWRPWSRSSDGSRKQAKHQVVDLDTTDGRATLRELVRRQITQWNEDHKRGLRPMSLVDVTHLADRAYRNLAEYGPLTALLDDDDVWEIMINAPDAIFVRRHRGTSGYHDEAFHDDDHVVRTLTKLLDDASTAHRKLDRCRGPPGRPARQRRPAPHRAPGHRPWRPSDGQHPQVHRGRLHLARPARRSRHDQPAGCGVPPRSRTVGPDHRDVGLAGVGQDHDAVVLRRRARPHQAGRHRRGGLRGRRAAGQRREHADPCRTSRPRARRSATARRRVPADGARCRHRRRGS